MSDEFNSKDNGLGGTSECPCGATNSYTGGHCFGCGVWRPQSKKDVDGEPEDMVDGLSHTYGWRIRRYLRWANIRDGSRRNRLVDEEYMDFIDDMWSNAHSSDEIS
jgi:hypothetical protein